MSFFVDRGFVIVPAGPVAERLAVVVRLGLREWSTRNGHEVPEVRALLEDLDRAARAGAAQLTQPVETYETASEASVRTLATLTAAQVADGLGISQQAVTQAARRGALLGRRCGRQWRFTVDDVQDYATERRLVWTPADTRNSLAEAG